MHGSFVWATIGQCIVPYQQHAGLGCDLDPDLGEMGFTAFFDIVEKDHCGPAALTAALAFTLPVLFSRIKPVIVWFE